MSSLSMPITVSVARQQFRRFLSTNYGCGIPSSCRSRYTYRKTQPISCRRACSSKVIKLRMVTDKDEHLKEYFMKTLTNETLRPGGRPAIDDVNNLLACDPTGVFVGELDGKPVCQVAMLKFDHTVALVSCYAAEKEIQGLGQVWKFFNDAYESVSPSHNTVCYMVDDILGKVKEKFGAVPLWVTSRYDIDIPTAVQNLNQSPLSGVYRIQTIDEVDMKALFDYDLSVFGYQRQKFLQMFLHARENHARVAVNKDGVIVGYAAATVAFIQEQGYRLGPLYADSLEIAQALLRAILKDVLENGISSSPSIVFDVSLSKTPEAKKLIELVDGKVLYDMTLVSFKGPAPKGRFEKWFAMTSSELG